MSTTENEVFRFFDLSNFRERLFVPAMKEAQVPVIRYHDLRHTIASHLAMRGVPLLKIKELLGHPDYKTTLRYTHLAPSQMDGITDVLLQAQPQVHSNFGRLSAVQF
jgi:site-specific recombinase XerD